MRIRTILLAVAAALVTATPLAAQSAEPAMVALVERLPDSAATAVVIRRAAGAGDVILLREAGATAEQLAAAIALLVQSRDGDGTALPGMLRLRISSASLQRPLPGDIAGQLEAALNRARRTAPADLAGVGAARATSLPLTRFRSRSR
jgi:hypothetical protein